MKRLFLTLSLLALFAAPALAQNPARRIYRETTDPATCATGDVLFNTTSGAMKVCTAANTWSTVNTSAPVSLPVADTTAVVKGSADETKQLRFEVDGFTAGTTRVLTPPNYDGTIATLAGTETLSNKTLTAPNIGAATGTSVALGTNPATSGIVALPNNQGIVFRNAANSANVTALTVNPSNSVVVGNSSATLSLSELWNIDAATGALNNASTYPVRWTNQGVAVGASGTSGLAEINNGTVGTWRDLKLRQHYVDATMTAGGTTGAQTINKAAGSVNFAAGASSLVVTNNLVTTSSIVICTVQTNDSTALVKNCVPAAGGFTINLNAAATAETVVAFLVINK